MLVTEQKATSKATTCSSELQKISPMDPTSDNIDRGPTATEGGKVIGAPEPAASQPEPVQKGREGGVRPRQHRSKHQNMQKASRSRRVCVW